MAGHEFTIEFLDLRVWTNAFTFVKPTCEPGWHFERRGGRD